MESNFNDPSGVLCADCGCYPCMCESPTPEIEFYCVAIVLEDKGYGGPEEGGWWYYFYEPRGEYGYLTRCFKTEQEAFDYERELRIWIEKEKLNEGRRSISSVLSEGRFSTYVYRGEYPKYKPDEKPHYE